MSTNPNYRKYPSSWGPVVAVLLIIGGMASAIIGSWRLSDGLNGIVIDHTNPFVHFMETTASQEITDGIILLVFGGLCFVTFIVLFFIRRKFLFPPDK
jgi:predicted permease